MSESSAELFWNKYVSNLEESEIPENPHIETSMPGDASITNKLIDLYVNGMKTAGSSVLEDFITAGDELPKEGNYWIVLDEQQVPKCILKTTKVVQHKFFDVPAEIAIAEAEGDLSISDWRTTHHNFFAPYLSAWNLSKIDDATIITEFYELVFK